MDAWRPLTTSWEATQLQYKLKNIKEGEHYREDLKPTGKERTFMPAKMSKENDVSQAKQYLQGLMSDRMRRDFSLDAMNPRQELSKFAKYVDENPAFDTPPLTMIGREDLAAKQQIELVVSGRESFVMEENRFNKSLDDQDNSLDPNPALREYDRRTAYTLARENALSQISSL